MNAQPAGLGFLFTGGYVQTLNLAFCPSASNMRNSGSNRGHVANSLEAVRLLCGDSPTHLTHGNYDAVRDGHDRSFDNRNVHGNLYWAHDARTTGLGAHYSYRLMPLVTWRGWMNQQRIHDDYRGRFPGVRQGPAITQESLASRLSGPTANSPAGQSPRTLGTALTTTP